MTLFYFYHTQTMEDWADTLSSHRGGRGNKRGLGQYNNGMGASGILKTLAKIVREEAVASGATGSRVLDSEIFTGTGRLTAEGPPVGGSSSNGSSSSSAGAAVPVSAQGEDAVQEQEQEGDEGLFQFGQVFKVSYW